jgi:hypothetical protein
MRRWALHWCRDSCIMSRRLSWSTNHSRIEVFVPARYRGVAPAGRPPDELAHSKWA